MFETQRLVLMPTGGTTQISGERPVLGVESHLSLAIHQWPGRQILPGWQVDGEHFLLGTNFQMEAGFCGLTWT